MKQVHRNDQAPVMLDAIIERITVNAHGDDETFWAFRQAFEDNIVVPCDAFVIGEPVSVIEFDYDGNDERVFHRMLWLNPSDNQGARFLIGPVQARATWQQDRQKR